MPRQSRSRPAARPAPAPAPQQSRGAHTVAAPAQPHSNVPAQRAPGAPVPASSSGGPGMLAQMAATAGSVAVGSTIGHGLSSMLFGGSSHAPAPVEQAAAPVAPQSFQQGVSCDVQARDFTKCLEAADPASCNWYLEQLKACQAAARPY
ncbi:hypothetical protein BS47DRAFT_1314092 [Hydnum rufescens UP504]|uniref:CHCH domain-containing protein n=1 Tax=Hydnum rufescens UP504 TaxID=1448309 RepID=A0A9P6B4W8_9AGAM|nr:hypothetical protein BS47DRAFT_1314092 [Hydnum rufescens UP504]